MFTKETITTATSVSTIPAHALIVSNLETTIIERWIHLVPMYIVAIHNFTSCIFVRKKVSEHMPIAADL